MEFKKRLSDIENNDMDNVCTETITGPAAWLGSDFANDTSWIYTMSDVAINELKTAVSGIKEKGLCFPNFSKEDFILPSLSNILTSYSQEIETGRGFMLIRGIPVDTCKDETDLNILYFGIGLHLGTPVRQNPQGHFIGTVMNTGDHSDNQTRVYETNLYLPYHSDPSDLVGLLCIQPAKSGGVSSLISSTSIYNAMLKLHPEYLPHLYTPKIFPHVGDRPCLSPIFSFHQNLLSCRYMRQYIELGHATLGPPLSTLDRETFDLLDKIMNKKEMKIDMMMQPGDLQLLNNYTVLHSRTSFEDYNEEKLRRKKLRIWLKNPYARKLGYDFPGRNGFPKPD